VCEAGARTGAPRTVAHSPGPARGREAIAALGAVLPRLLIRVAEGSAQAELVALGHVDGVLQGHVDGADLVLRRRLEQGLLLRGLGHVLRLGSLPQIIFLALKCAQKRTIRPC